MSTQLHAASSQWATRPADERFWNLRDMRIACESSRAGSAVARRKFGELRAARRVGREIAFVGQPVLQAKRAKNVGGVPFDKVVVGLEVRHRTTPLSCNAIRKARSA